MAQVNYELAKIDPARTFKHPHEVVEQQTLTREQKIDILRRWAYEEREMAVAEEENMQSPHPQNNVMDEILKTLLELGVDKDQTMPPPTKQG